MARHSRRITRVRPILFLALAIAVLTPVATHAEAVEPALIATMRAMAAALLDIEKFTKTPGDQPPPVDSARKVVMLAKSIPGIFPPGSELEELPSKFDSPATSWDDFDRFLDAQKHLVVETSKLFATTTAGDREAIARQVTTTRQACAACHGKFRN